MGTRSLTQVVDKQGNILVSMYRQYDGYPSGMGADLRKFLDGMVLVNGMRMNHNPKKFANGLGCLAAQLVAHFKEEPGGIYLHIPKPISSDNHEEYNYIITPAGEYDEYGSPLGALSLKCVTVSYYTKEICDGSKFPTMDKDDRNYETEQELYYFSRGEEVPPEEEEEEEGINEDR